MEHDDRREIFERLEALERLTRSRSGEGGGREEHRRGDRDRHDRDNHGHDHHDHDHHDFGHQEHGHHDRDRGRGEGEFEEKRIIDTVVRLVVERVGRVIQDQQAKGQRPDDGGEERRIVDLVVRLVSERVREIVQEIVSTELDRRLGRPGDERPPGSGTSEPEQR